MSLSPLSKIKIVPEDAIFSCAFNTDMGVPNHVVVNKKIYILFVLVPIPFSFAEKKGKKPSLAIPFFPFFPPPSSSSSRNCRYISLS